MSRFKTTPEVFKYNDDGFFTEISTNTTEDFPKVVFIRTKVHITPKVAKKTYEKEILFIKEEFERNTLNIIKKSKTFDKDFLFNVNIAEKSVQINKRSHLRYDLFLKPINETTLNQNKKELEKIFTKLNTMLLNLFQTYNFKVISTFSYIHRYLLKNR